MAWNDPHILARATIFGALRGVPARKGRAARRRSKPEGKAFPTNASHPHLYDTFCYVRDSIEWLSICVTSS